MIILILRPGQSIAANLDAFPAAIVGGLIGGFFVDWVVIPFWRKWQATRNG